MGAGTDNTVSIVIKTVDESSGVISNGETKLTGLGTAGTAAGARVAGIGPAVKQVGNAAGGLPNPLIPPVPPEVHEQLNKVHGNMREVSGMAHEAGISMGWSMRQLVASSPAAMAALKALSGA